MLFRKSRKSEYNQTITLKKQKRSMDWVLLFTIVGLCLFGLLMVFDASVVSALRDFGDKYHFVREQGIWLILGLILMTIIAYVDYHQWYIYSDFLLLGVAVLLVGVFIPGVGITALGASRWINFRLFVLQPAELTKLALVIYLSSWLSYTKTHRLLPFLGILGFIVGLIVLEPDLGTAIIVTAISITLYFLSGSPLWHFVLLVPVVLCGGGLLTIVAPYRMERLLTFLNPNNDPLGSSYHIRQVLLSLGSGGIFGLGIGKSRQKYEYLPEASTDSIFAVVGEEFGFLGAVVLISVFVFILYRLVQVSKHASDSFGKLVSAGVACWIAYQAAINLSAMAALLPLTGVPLSFVSYGGSNLVVTLIGVGIVLNISKHRNA